MSESNIHTKFSQCLEEINSWQREQNDKEQNLFYDEKFAFIKACEVFDKAIPHFKELSIIIHSSSGNTFMVSNLFPFFAKLQNTGLSRGYSKFKKEAFIKQNYLIHSDDVSGDFIDQMTESLYKKYQIHQCYSIYRETEGYKFIFNLSTDTKIENKELFYKKTINQFEASCSSLIDDISPILIRHFSDLRFSFNVLRGEFIFNRQQQQIRLSEKEKNILYLVSIGKKNKEISEIINLTINTVITYRKRLKIKLNAQTIAEAIKIATMKELIN